MTYSITKERKGKRNDKVKSFATRSALPIALIAGLVSLPATADATEQNIGERGNENCKYEWWGVNRPDLNPNGLYAYYVQEEPYDPYDPDKPKIKDVTGWHNTGNTGDTSANSHMAVIGGNLDLDNVYGGYSTNGAANNNVLIVNSGTISGNVTGGYAKENATANGNQVFIYGGNFEGTAAKASVSGGQGKDANDNMVVVYGGTFSYEINGGVIMRSEGKATNNTVVLAGNFFGNPGIYGGNVGDTTYTVDDIVTGNTLEVWIKGKTVNNIKNFENYYFILPAGIKSGDTVLTVDSDGSTEFTKKANIGVAVASRAKLYKGDKVTLIRNAAGFTGEGYQKVSLADKTLKGQGGVSLKYDFELSDTETTIDATVISASVDEQTKSIVEARAASLGVANAGADLVAGQAMHSAMANTAAAKAKSANPGSGAASIAPFTAMSGGTQRIESGSYVDVSGVSAVLGLAARKDINAVAFTGGGFFEFGASHFKSHNSFDTGDVDGTGHANYQGGGLLGRLDITESPLKGIYLESVFRVGGMQSNWHSDDLRDAVTGKSAFYDTNSSYIGAHLGLGYVLQANDTLKVDFYGKWSWTCVSGDDVYVADDLYTFKDADSYRLRFGARTDWNVTEQFGIYAGAAWEREFDGKARATVYGFDVPAPSIKGNTGVFDFGFSLKPGDVPNLTMELGATAMAGVRRGVMGSLMVKYEF